MRELEHIQMTITKWVLHPLLIFCCLVPFVAIAPPIFYFHYAYYTLKRMPDGGALFNDSIWMPSNDYIFQQMPIWIGNNSDAWLFVYSPSALLIAWFLYAFLHRRKEKVSSFAKRLFRLSGATYLLFMLTGWQVITWIND